MPKAPDVDLFRQRIRERIERDPNLNMTNLAVKAGLHNTAVRNMLNGRVKHPQINTVIAILRALDTTLEDLMNESDGQEDRDTLRLLSRLSVDERAQLLGLARGIAEARDRAPKQAPEGIA